MYKSFFIYILLFPFVLFAQNLYEEIIIPPDPQQSGYFGNAIEVSDNFLFISSLRYNSPDQNCVYVYSIEGDSYSFLYKLQSSDHRPGDLFGSKLALHDDRLLVGARNSKNNAGFEVGALYAFHLENNHWVQKQKLTPPPSFYAVYSNSLFTYGDYLLVSAANFAEIGKVFLYKYDKLSSLYKLLFVFDPPDPSYRQWFGGSLLMTDQHIYITSPAENTPSGINSGAVYVYHGKDTSWELTHKYIPESNSDYLGFGTNIAFNGEFIFIGSGGIYGYSKPSKVFVYKLFNDSLDLTQTLTTGNNFSGDLFGGLIVPHKDSIFVSALWDTVGSGIPGSVYIFENDNGYWNKVGRMVAYDPENVSDYGIPLRIHNDIIYVGSRSAKINGIRSGSVFVYSRFPLPVNDGNNIKNEFHLFQNYPNPFNPTTTINYSIAEAGVVTIKVYDILGSEVVTLVNEQKGAGVYSVSFNGEGLPSGVYLYRIHAGSFISSRKLLLVK